MSNFINSIYNASSGDANVYLGDIELGYFEVPEYFDFGGQQMVAVHQMLGGSRSIDSLGGSEMNKTFSGAFLGETASERARAVDFMRNLGVPVEFICGEFIYLVIITSFVARYERSYQIPYTITLTVVKNLTLPEPFPEPNGYNNAVSSDANYVNSLSPNLNNNHLNEAVNNLNESISNAGNLSKASNDQLNNIKNSIQNCLSIIDEIINQNKFK